MKGGHIPAPAEGRIAMECDDHYSAVMREGKRSLVFTHPLEEGFSLLIRCRNNHSGAAIDLSLFRYRNRLANRYLR